MLSTIRFGLSVATQPSDDSAFKLLCGTVPRLEAHMVLTDPAGIPSKPDKILSQLWPELYVLRQEAMANIKHADNRMKEAYDRRHQARPLDIEGGNYVWLIQEKSWSFSQHKPLMQFEALTHRY